MVHRLVLIKYLVDHCSSCSCAGPAISYCSVHEFSCKGQTVKIGLSSLQPGYFIVSIFNPMPFVIPQLPRPPPSLTEPCLVRFKFSDLSPA